MGSYQGAKRPSDDLQEFFQLMFLHYVSRICVMKLIKMTYNQRNGISGFNYFPLQEKRIGRTQDLCLMN